MCNRQFKRLNTLSLLYFLYIIIIFVFQGLLNYTKSSLLLIFFYYYKLELIYTILRWIVILFNYVLMIFRLYFLCMDINKQNY
jgi:hypothetical protein